MILFKHCRKYVREKCRTFRHGLKLKIYEWHPDFFIGLTGGISLYGKKLQSEEFRRDIEGKNPELESRQFASVREAIQIDALRFRYFWRRIRLKRLGYIQMWRIFWESAYGVDERADEWLQFLDIQPDIRMEDGYGEFAPGTILYEMQDDEPEEDEVITICWATAFDFYVWRGLVSWSGLYWLQPTWMQPMMEHDVYSAMPYLVDDEKPSIWADIKEILLYPNIIRYIDMVLILIMYQPGWLFALYIIIKFWRTLWLCWGFHDKTAWEFHEWVRYELKMNFDWEPTLDAAIYDVYYRYFRSHLDVQYHNFWFVYYPPKEEAFGRWFWEKVILGEELYNHHTGSEIWQIVYYTATVDWFAWLDPKVDYITSKIAIITNYWAYINSKSYIIEHGYHNLIMCIKGVAFYPLFGAIIAILVPYIATSDWKVIEGYFQIFFWRRRPLHTVYVEKNPEGLPLLSYLRRKGFHWNRHRFYYFKYSISAIVSMFFVFVSTAWSYYFFYYGFYVWETNELRGTLYTSKQLSPDIYLKLMTWIKIGLVSVDWAFFVDKLTVVMLIVVTTISLLVHIYSISYMRYDPSLPRFLSYLSLFTFFMLMLVCADNFIQLFFGWEGVGICSYLLISFWNTRIPANKAAIKALVVNRIGDFGLLVGISLIFWIFRALDYYTVFSLAPYFYGIEFTFLNMEVDILSTICFFLFIGAVGKSAQLGLHTWLPDAMEGPTPVSALIHAATMVTAGVFLLIRCSFLFEYAPDILILITIMGAATAFFAATVGLVQNDLKKVIAYSTCSQLGYMVFACGLSQYTVGLFHLANHAFFKALLFLTAGAVIHAVQDEQDMRKLGGLKNLLPYSYMMTLVGSLALMGFPFLTGFYSKDVILEIAYTKYSFHSCFAYWLGTLAAFFTAFYSWRLIYLTFLSRPNGYKKVLINAVEPDKTMRGVLFILAIGSIFVGYFTRDMFIGMGSSFFRNAIFIHPKNLLLIEAEFIPVYIKLIPVCFSISGGLTALGIYHGYNYLITNVTFSWFGREIYIFLSKKWFFDKIYNTFIAKKILDWGYKYTFKELDKGVIEYFGPYGGANIIYRLSRFFSKQIHTGIIYNYAAYMSYSFLIIVFVSCYIHLF